MLGSDLEDQFIKFFLGLERQLAGRELLHIMASVKETEGLCLLHLIRDHLQMDRRFLSEVQSISPDTFSPVFACSQLHALSVLHNGTTPSALTGLFHCMSLKDGKRAAVWYSWPQSAHMCVCMCARGARWQTCRPPPLFFFLALITQGIHDSYILA